MGAALRHLAEVRRYCDSWNTRDLEGLLAAFAPGGTYTDPAVTGPPLSGPTLEAHA